MSVAYYRAGYTPTDYPSESEWQARQLVEESAAIKCPSVGYQLAGTKKIQQVLTQKNVLEKYLTSDQCATLRQCFAQQYRCAPTHWLTHSRTHWLTHSPTGLLTHLLAYSLTHSLTYSLTHSPTHSLTHSPTHSLTHSRTHLLTHLLTPSYSLLLPSLSNIATDSATKSALEAALRDGRQWVLKPQREGGGNNYYNQELSEFLQANAAQGVLNSYVLMRRIFPQEKQALLLRKGQLVPCKTISELGIYGTFLGTHSPNHLLTHSPNHLLTHLLTHSPNHLLTHSFLGSGSWEETKPVINMEAGYLLRTKPCDSDEGGVASGYSVLNSIALTGVGKKEWEEVEVPTEEASARRDYEDRQEIEQLMMSKK